MEDVKNIFFKFLNDEIPVQEFEQWVYGAVDVLEDILDVHHYLDLLALEFSTRRAKIEIDQILLHYVDLGEYEVWKIKRLLASFLQQECHPLQALCQFYDLYCHGHSYLESLALEYGLLAKAPPGNTYSADSWEQLSSTEQQRLSKLLLPGAVVEAQKILSRLEDGKILFEARSESLGHWQCVDRR